MSWGCVATGLAARRHHDTAYTVFRSACWEWDDLGLMLATLVLTHLVPGGVVWVAVDDTLCHKRGANVAFGGILLDAVMSSRRHKTFRFGVVALEPGVAARRREDHGGDGAADAATGGHEVRGGGRLQIAEQAGETRGRKVNEIGCCDRDGGGVSWDRRSRPLGCIVIPVPGGGDPMPGIAACRCATQTPKRRPGHPESPEPDYFPGV